MMQAPSSHRYSERAVVRFMVADEENPGSMVSALANAREIARTIRDILPREVWEHINGLHHYVAEHAAEAINKRTRYAFLNHVILGTQTFNGMLESIVSVLNGAARTGRVPGRILLGRVSHHTSIHRMRT